MREARIQLTVATALGVAGLVISAAPLTEYWWAFVFGGAGGAICISVALQYEEYSLVALIVATVLCVGAGAVGFASWRLNRHQFNEPSLLHNVKEDTGAPSGGTFHFGG